jgi:hypothetical protein
MVVMLPYSYDDIVSMFQFLAQARRQGRPLWPLFWHGGAVEGARVDPSPPLSIRAQDWLRPLAQGAALPKALLISAAIGAWLMFTRVTFGHTGAMADSDHLVGSLVFTFSICAFSEVARPLRAINFLFGAWLLASPWLLQGASASGTAGVMLAGAALIALALPRGPIEHRYAGWDRVLLW